MRRLLRTLFCLRRPTPATMTAASSGTLAGVAAAAYTLSVSVPIEAADAPSDAKNKTHHNKSGTGFINPWESWKPLPPFQILSSILWCATSPPLPQTQTNTPPGAASPAQATPPASSPPSPYKPPPSSPPAPPPPLSAPPGSATHAYSSSSPPGSASSSTPSSRTAARPPASQVQNATRPPRADSQTYQSSTSS